MKKDTIKSGVYFLFRENELIYIGMSSHIPTRIASHRTNGREFDKYYVIWCELADAYRLEESLIMAFMPMQNKVYNRNSDLYAKKKSFEPVIEEKVRKPDPIVVASAAVDDGRAAYRVKEVCQMFGISPAHFYSLRKSGRIRTFKLGGRTLVAKQDALAFAQVNQ